MPYAIDLNNLPIGADETPVGVPVRREAIPLTPPLSPERQAIVDRIYEQQGLVTRPIERESETEGNIDLTNRPSVKNDDGSISTVKSMSINEDGKEVLIPMVSEDGKMMNEKEAIDYYHKTGKHLGKFNSVEEANAAAEKIHQSEAKKLSSSKTEEKPTSGRMSRDQILGSELPTFEDTFKQAQSGNAKALAMLKYAAGVNGYADGFEVGKDGKAYYMDDKGNRMEVDMETAKEMYDRVAESAYYVNRWYQRQNRSQGQGQPQVARRAVATEYDPHVLESLRTRAILKSDPNGLIAYTKMPYDIENTAARTDYARAGMALRQARGVQGAQEKWVPQEDGTYLVEDAETGRPLYSVDKEGNEAPWQAGGRSAEYSKQLESMQRELDEGETVQFSRQAGFYVKDRQGRVKPWGQYLKDKAAGEQPTGTAARKKPATQKSEPKKEAINTNAYRNLGTLRLDDR